MAHVGKWLAVASIIVGLSMVGVSQVRVQNLTDDLAREAELRKAQQCVAGYERVDQLRAMGEFIIEANADTLLHVPVRPGPDPGREERIKIYQELVQGDVKEAKEIVQPVTPCDLDEAKRLLGQD